MTEWYTEGGTVARLNNLVIDDKLQGFLDTIKLEETTNKIFNFVHSDKPLSGSHGKAIVAMRDNVPHIYGSWDIIYQSVKNGTLSLHGTLHSYCKNGYNCDMDGVINPAFAWIAQVEVVSLTRKMLNGGKLNTRNLQIIWLLIHLHPFLFIHTA